MNTRNLTIHSVIFILLVLSGCSANPPVTEGDPLEGMNRKVYAFNTSADKMLFKPIAEGYDAALPAPVKESVSNVFSNLSEIPNSFNNLLQGKVKNSATSLLRFGMNSTIGVLGMFDPATDVGVNQTPEDLGQTLAVWGVPSGPYVVLPFLGPSNVRDGSASLLTTAFLDEGDLFFDQDEQTALAVANVIQIRHRLLPTDKLLEAASIDPYEYTKSGYMQYRAASISGKKVEQKNEQFEDELFEEDVEFSDDDLFK